MTSTTSSSTTSSNTTPARDEVRDLRAALAEQIAAAGRLRATLATVTAERDAALARAAKAEEALGRLQGKAKGPAPQMDLFGARPPAPAAAPLAPPAPRQFAPAPARAPSPPDPTPDPAQPSPAMLLIAPLVTAGALLTAPLPEAPREAATKARPAQSSLGLETGPARVWSPMQVRIFETVTAPGMKRSVVVEALAGASKTTVIVECARRLAAQGKKMLALAFNRDIKRELAERMEGVEVHTLNAFGMTLLKHAYPASIVDPRVAMKRLTDEGFFPLSPGTSGSDKMANRIQIAKARGVRKLAAHMKSTLAMSREEFPGVVEFTEVDPFLLTPGDREAIEGAPPEVRALVEGRALTALHQTVLRYLDVNRAEGHRVFDQDDMLWLPTELGLPMPRYDVVFIDEVQDLSEVQLRLLMALVRAGARVVAVGDRFQRIYEFRGVKHDTFDRLIAMLDALVLPLSITYRCGRAIVDEVRKRFWHIPLEAGPSNPAAVVEHFTALPVAALLPGDMVISRSNAPLLAACIEALRRGIPSAILGKDFAKAMLEPLTRAKKEVGTVGTPKQTVEAIRARLIHDLQEQAEAAEEIGEDAGEFVDRIECYQMLFAGCSSIEEVERLLTRSHVDKTTSRQVTFTTVHKAKGLEARRVYVLLHTFHAADQNLLYVALTRGKEYAGVVEEKKK